MKTTELQEATLPTLTSHSEPHPRIDNKALEAILQCSVAPAKLNDEQAQSSIQIDKDVLARASTLPRLSNKQVFAA
jgi:uncharacterized protein (DUF4415 family)